MERVPLILLLGTMKRILIILIYLTVFNSVSGQAIIDYPDNFKTIHDTTFSVGDILIVEYHFPLRHLRLEPDEWSISLSQFIQNHTEFDCIIVSHTETRGSAESNITLSTKRGQSVVKDMIELGVDQSRIYAVGKGETKPIYSDEMIANFISAEEKEKAHQVNRRIELHLVERKN